jgi:hypothetical protein
MPGGANSDTLLIVSTMMKPLVPPVISPVILSTSGWSPVTASVSQELLCSRHEKSYMDAISAIDAVVIIVKIHVAM